MARKKDEAAQRQEALDRAVAQIEKEYGKGAIMMLGSEKLVEVPAISTGALSLDLALGVGGIPRGRVTEVYGPEASGKTTLCLHVVASAQKTGGIAAYIDAEHAVDPAYAKRLGVDVENLLISQPDTGEQALQIAEMLVRSNAVDVVVIDSVAALVPKAELDGEMGDQQIGLQARLMSKALRKLTGAISKSRTAMIFINQIRMKIGVMFGSPETTPGGRALKFYSSVRIEVRRIANIKDGDQTTGTRVRGTVKKNKVAAPYRRAEFDIMFNQGISWEGDLIDLGIEAELVQKQGAWFSMGETRLGQGRERAKETLRSDPELAERLKAGILQSRAPKTAFLEPKAEGAQPAAESG